MTYNILIVDDQEDIRQLLSSILKDEGYEAHAVSTGQEAFDYIASNRPSLVILDVWLKDAHFDGLHFLEIIKQTYPNLPVVMISGHGTIETAVNSLQKGAYDFIEKPFKIERLLNIVSKGIEFSKLNQELEMLRQDLEETEELEGASPQTVFLRQNIERLSKNNSRVLMEGPAGVGKETIARLIHKHSPRKDQPFVVINCSNLNPGSFEADFFGKEAKSESGDLTINLGLLERADRGTLYLDNIQDMPPETQSKILQAIQEQKFYRVGGRTPIHVNVRIVSATGVDLKKRISEGLFRQDLYYRLNVVSLEVPPLASRREDIKSLVDLFSRKIAQKTGALPKKFSKEALAALEAYHWPGNIRQLQNVVEWVMIMHPEEIEIKAHQLPGEVQLSNQKEVEEVMDANLLLGLRLKEAREEFEKTYISLHVKRFNGNISKTAAAIGMERTALHRKIKLLTLPEEQSKTPLEVG